MVIAEVGVAAALCGFVLVFLGVLISSYQSLIGSAAKATLERFKRAAWIALSVFVLGLVSLALSSIWLMTDGGRCLYVVTLVAFFALLVGLLVAAVYSTWRVLLR